MKRIVLSILLITVTAGGMLFAQQGNRRDRIQGQGRQHFQPFAPACGPMMRDPMRGRQMQWFNRTQLKEVPTVETMTLSGALGIRQGRIAIEKEGQTWYVRGLNRFIGFIDGLKEGAVVTLEGRGVKSAREENTGFLEVTRLTLNGKTYDLSLTGQKN